MASNTKQLPRDADSLPVSSHYNTSADRHDATQGASGASRVRIADGDDPALGARSDAASTGSLSGSFSVVSLLKEAVGILRTLNPE